MLPHIPFEDVPPVVRVLHRAVLTWLFFSWESKCIFPGVFPKNPMEEKRERILLGYKTPLNLSLVQIYACISCSFS